jgi:hypothetical protein
MSKTIEYDGKSSEAVEASGDSSAPLPLWQLYALLGMMAAAAAVWVSRHTHPLALILISGAAIASAFVALALHRAIFALLGRGGDIEPLAEGRREMLEREKMLVLRGIKELEFDRAMGKIGEADFTFMERQLRARALALMQDLERTAVADAERPAGRKARPAARPCPDCGTRNDRDARFCKQCGRSMAAGN